MPKYDAFGREIGENTLAGLGGKSAPPREQRAHPEEPRPEPAAGARPAPAPRPTASPSDSADRQDASRRDLAARLEGALTQVAAARATAAPPRGRAARRSSGSRGCLGVFVVGFVALAAVGGLVGGSTKTGSGGATKSIPAPESQAPAPAPAPRGVGGRSLVRRANLAAALRRLRTPELRLTHLRVAPERIDATLLTRGGRLRTVQIKPGGAVERFGSDSGPGFDSTGTIPFARLDTAAPERLARRGAAKLGVPVAKLQYLVPTYSLGTLTWAAYFPRSRYVIGDAAGHYQRSYP